MSDLRWVIFANAGASTHQHVDTAGTVFTCVTGTKIFAIAVRRNDLKSKDYRGRFDTRQAFTDWEGSKSNTEVFRWEFFILRPGQVLYVIFSFYCVIFSFLASYMRPTTIHYVISVDDCIAEGLHEHTMASIGASIHATLHNVVADDATTNADHSTARWLFLRIFHYAVDRICAGTCLIL